MIFLIHCQGGKAKNIKKLYNKTLTAGWSSIGVDFISELAAAAIIPRRILGGFYVSEGLTVCMVLGGGYFFPLEVIR